MQMYVELDEKNATNEKQTWQPHQWANLEHLSTFIISHSRDNASAVGGKNVQMGTGHWNLRVKGQKLHDNVGFQK